MSTRCPTCNVPTSDATWWPCCSPRCYYWRRFGTPILREGYMRRQRLLNETKTHDD